jgi:hypothetical protein
VGIRAQSSVLRSLTKHCVQAVDPFTKTGRKCGIDLGVTRRPFPSDLGRTSLITRPGSLVSARGPAGIDLGGLFF